MRLNNLCSAPFGSEVRFWYKGGGTPQGGWRDILVDTVEHGFLKGVDIDKPEDNQYRQYNRHNASDVEIVAMPKRTEKVHFTDARVELDSFIRALDGESLAELYEHLMVTEGGSTSYNTLTGCIETEYQSPRVVGEVCVSVSNPRGTIEVFGTISEDGNIRVAVDGKEQVMNPEEWAAFLLQLQG